MTDSKVSSIRSLTWIVALILALPLTAATRIAIVADGDSPTLDLLTAKLSSIPDVELLERREIRGILKEQSISAATLDSKNAFALGKLLKADLFAVLECDPKTNKPFGFIVFDAKTGVRYWDSAIPSDNPEKTAKCASKSVDAALKKRALDSKGKLKYVSLLSLRNVDLPADKDPFCNAVGALLLRILGNSANFAVLDRSHLDYLNKERNLPGMRWTKKLLGSNILLKLEFKRGGDGAVASLQIGNVPQPPINCSLKIPLQTASEIAELLGRSNLKKAQRNLDVSAEAKRFEAEYSILIRHNMRNIAFGKISTAKALAPGNRRIALKHMRTMAELGCELMKQGKFNTGLVLLERSLSSADKLYDSNNPFRTNLSLPIFVRESSSLTRTMRLLRNRYSFESYHCLSATQKKQLYKIYIDWRRQNERTLREADLKNNLRPYKTAKDFDRCNDYYWRMMDSETFFSTDSCLLKFLPLFREWLKIAEKYAKHHKLSHILNIWWIMKSFLSNHPNLTEKTRREFSKTFTEMTHSESPVIRAFGMLFNYKLHHNYILMKKMKSTKLKQSEFFELDTLIHQQYYSAYMKKCVKELNALPLSATSEDKEAYYYILCQAFPYPYSKYENLLKIYKIMMRRNEISSQLVFQNLLIPINWESHTKESIKVFSETKANVDSRQTICLPSKKELKIRINDATPYCAIALRTLKSPHPNKFWISTTQIATLDYDKYLRCIVACSSPDKTGSIYIAIKDDKFHQEDSRSKLSLFRISHDDGSMKPLNQILLPLNFYVGNSVIHKATIFNGYFITPTQSGIIFIPLEKGKKFFTITKKDGLQADDVKSLCVHRGKIYAIIYESDYDNRRFLISCEPRPGAQPSTLDTSISSSISGNFLTPISRNHNDPVAIFSMLNNRKLIIMINQSLFEYDPIRKMWEKIIDGFYVSWSTKLDEERLLISSSWAVFICNAKDKSLKVVASQKHPDKNVRALGKSRLLLQDSDYGVEPPLAITRRGLWTGWPFSCTSFNTGLRTTYQSLNPNDKSPISQVCLYRNLGDDKLLVADHNGVYILKLK